MRQVITIFLFCFIGALSGCGSGGGFSDGSGGETNEQPTLAVATVTVSPVILNANRLGQRQQFTAMATDAFGNPIPGVAFTWESSATTVAKVDATGLTTTWSDGETRVTATAEGVIGEAEVSVRSEEDRSDTGEMFTVWFARTDRAPALLENGYLRVPNIYGSVNPITPWRHGEIEKFQWEGNRIGILSDMSGDHGTFRVRDRHEEWAVLGKGNTTDFQLEDNRIGVLTNDGTFLVKEGVHGPWTTLESSGVKKFQLEGNRIAVLRADGVFRVKDGIHGAWTVLASINVKDFQLDNNRIAVLFDNGPLMAKYGIHGTWTELEPSGVQQFQLLNNHVGVLREDGVYLTKEGIYDEWQALADAGGREFQLGIGHVAALFEDGSLKTKDFREIDFFGRFFAWDDEWFTHATGGVQAFQLQGNLLGILTDTNKLRVEVYGDFFGWSAGWRETPEYSTAVTQFQLSVSVPVPPERITPPAYSTTRQPCLDNSPVPCQESPYPAIPVAHYGRFCGAWIPEDAYWSTALAAGSIDPFDELCLHHDHQPSWYPEAEGFGECIVRYGIVNSKLTKDGRVLTEDSPEWDSIWAKMPHLYQAIYLYDWYTIGCTSNELDTFSRATAY